jgi:hypothetical protein
METLSKIITAGLIVLICWFIYIILKKILSKRKPIALPRRVKIKADRKFNKLLRIFKRKYKRKPTKNELFRIIISASHITIRKRGKRGHWGRQKIRKYLLEKHKIVDNYVMR